MRRVSSDLSQLTLWTAASSKNSNESLSLNLAPRGQSSQDAERVQKKYLGKDKGPGLHAKVASFVSFELKRSSQQSLADMSKKKSSRSMLEYANNMRSKQIGETNQEWNIQDFPSGSQHKKSKNPFLGKMLENMVSETANPASRGQIPTVNHNLRLRHQSMTHTPTQTELSELAKNCHPKRNSVQPLYHTEMQGAPSSPTKINVDSEDEKVIEDQDFSSSTITASLGAVTNDGESLSHSDFHKMSTEYRNKIDAVKSLVHDMDAKIKRMQVDSKLSYTSASQPIQTLNKTIDQPANVEEFHSDNINERNTRRAWWVEEEYESDHH